MNKEIEEQNEERLLRLKLLSNRLDEVITIPGTKYKIGSDPIIGAIPIIGDLLGSIISIYILYSGSKMGLSTKIISKMCLNIGIDFVFGLIPIIGDIFDIGWKANKRNVKLIEDNINKSDEKLFLNNLAVATLIITIIASFLLIIDKII
ncbi:MAG: hypothetical protein BET99_05185 [Marine Group III euryarchaeote CG-Epi2]|uniref:DUF4112 domain-containing protein n=1 Tax=Marine Group III euryarchaeote CG-Epi2 TaxID=1888996 RepID=A0A1J5U7V1_9ARCH|nr:MAG: hypothetical protein BET99_05185 [Marine Group III euryarchaeote CG-Epi2]|tara:strand:+ start:173 stop:619 length:447 start_codon:yes stop_codon:yes gene_type:complete